MECGYFLNSGEGYTWKRETAVTGLSSQKRTLCRGFMWMSFIKEVFPRKAGIGVGAVGQRMERG